MAKGNFVAYFRVSTAKQGASGLGLEAQRQAVATYLNGGDWKVIAEFVEVESGKRSDRTELQKATATARAHRCPLIVAKLDRLTRSASFLTTLLESGVEVRFCDLPQIEGPQGKFLLTSMAAVAELEAGMISGRTKSALAAAKARGTQLGGYREGTTIRPGMAAASAEAKRAKAKAIAADLIPIIRTIEAEGHTSLNAIAKALTERGVPTPAGGETWQAVQVRRVLDRA